jgi:glutamine---fructose-6-phosphate transaminase (isomerizing)
MSSLLEREIAEQGTVLAARVADAGAGGVGIRAVREAAALLAGGEVEHMLIAARGSSDNAARFAQYLFGEELGLDVGLAAPWLFRAPARAPALPHAAVVAISQSGRSPDIVSVVAAASGQGRPTIVLTEDVDSPLAGQADVVIPLLAGAEQSVAATKTYLASLFALVQVVQEVRPVRERGEWLERIPQLIADYSRQMLAERERFDPLAGVALITVTGRGLAYSTACESALKLRELTGAPAEAFSPPDLMHGPIAAVSSAGGAWLIEPGDELPGVISRTGPSVVVSAEARALEAASIPVPLPSGFPSWVAAIVGVLPAQAAALRLAELRKVDVDHPFGLSKVTLTQ